MADHRGGGAQVWHRPEAVFDGARLRRDLWVCVAGGLVTLSDHLPVGAHEQPLTGTVTPGYVDLQVNGGGGVLLNQTPSAEGMAAIAAAHRRFGTTSILPTLITDCPDAMTAAVDAALEAHAAGTRGIAGLHLEGPHIAVARKGTHSEALIRPLDDVTISEVARLRAAGVPVMLTVAPEACAPGQISALVETGAVVSLGHTEPTAEQTANALAEGADCFTHLFNAMPPMVNRTPGVAAYAINSRAYAGFICDGIHVDDAMLALAIRARPVPDRMFVVSDAMPTVGGPDHFELYDMDLRLKDGMLVNPQGSLAGAHVTMAESVMRLVGKLGIGAEDALRMAVTVPATLMSLPGLARLEGRSAEDVLVLAGDMSVQGTLAASVGAGSAG